MAIAITERLNEFVQRISWRLIRFLLVAVSGLGLVAGGSFFGFWAEVPGLQELQGDRAVMVSPGQLAVQQPIQITNGRPQLSPLPAAQEVWTCQVVVIGGSLGGVAAAAHAMQSGAVTCLIELTPWLGGQISSQGVSAIDESLTMRANQNFSQSWIAFKRRIEEQPVHLPSWVKLPDLSPDLPSVATINRCWVGRLCFPPSAGAIAAQQLLQTSAAQAEGSRWGTAIAFKGAAFDATGQEITAIYAVHRVPRSADDLPQGKLSSELASWYAWSADAKFSKIPLRLQAPAGQRLMVIDATDTGELVGWADIPHRLGSESRATTGEPHASQRGNPDCTQAFTYPFVIALHDDQGASLSALAQVEPEYSWAEHQQDFAIQGIPTFTGRSFFNYRRIVSTIRNDPFTATPVLGDMTAVNWNRGNDWNWMNPPLILSSAQLDASGQRQNWLGGISAIALKHAEDHALLFAQWILKTQTRAAFPLTYLAGADTPMGTVSGLSMAPYIREGRRILGRAAYGQREFMIREADLRRDLPGGRDFSATQIALTHYDIDIHGCRYRNWEPTGEASSAPVNEFKVRPVQIPLESLIPQGVDNLLIGGKSLAVTHIVNAVTRTHYSEWSVGAAAGSIAAWLVQQPFPITPVDIVSQRLMPGLQQLLLDRGLRLNW
jgi:hypothetical protein